MTSAARYQSNSDPQSASPLGSHAGWKLDMLTAMARDPLMRRVDVATAVLILQRSNAGTKVSAITDARLAQETGCNRATFAEFRKRASAAGYFDCVPGHSGRATTYKWKNDRLKAMRNMIDDQRIIAREETVGAQKTARSTRDLSTEKTRRSATAHRAREAERSARKSGPNMFQCAEKLAYSAKFYEHLHTDSSLEDSLPEEGRGSGRTYDAHVHAYDRWVSLEETAARLECDEELPRHEAEHRARILCGFDDEPAGGRQGAGTAPPTLAQSNPFGGNT